MDSVAYLSLRGGIVGLVNLLGWALQKVQGRHVDEDQEERGTDHVREQAQGLRDTGAAARSWDGATALDAGQQCLSSWTAWICRPPFPWLDLVLPDRLTDLMHH